MIQGPPRFNRFGFRSADGEFVKHEHYEMLEKAYREDTKRLREEVLRLQAQLGDSNDLGS